MTTGRLVLLRHGETEWSRSWRHTGRTDLPLTELGERQAAQLQPVVGGHAWAAVHVSPLQRARETARLAGLRPTAVDDDLMEWDYGDVEGITTKVWRETHPGWWLWLDGAPNGEDVHAVAVRARRALDRIRPELEHGDVALVAHGHLLRVLAAVWCELEPEAGARLRLDVASLSLLGFEHENPVVVRWNAPVAGDPLS